MKVTYLYNSGFIVELDKHILLFDYYQGNIPLLNPNKNLYIFVSHFHHDHYNPEIYQISHPKITYIIDRKINNKGIKVHPGKVYDIDDLHIQTLLSTDEGVAFVIKVENKYIYHAGDLHWWHWIGEPESANKYQAETFKKEISKITNINFELMMIPLDPRLKESGWWGMNYILKYINTKYVLPMHFIEDINKMHEYLDNKPLNQYNNIIKIHNKEEVFILGENNEY